MHNYYKQNKYGNKRTEVGGITFDSRKEAIRHGELEFLLRAGEIRDLQLQKRFELVAKNDKFKAVHYVCDFYYFDVRGGKWVVEDVKGFKTEVYKLKAKMFYDKYGIEITEV